jgi:DNA-binding NarL/FixJ family response regulator
LLEGGFDVCAETGNAQGVVAAVAEHGPAIALIEVRIPGNGIAAAAEITSRFPDTCVVMLTASRKHDDLFDSLRAGAMGYLLKDTDPERLPHALRGVLNGEAALPRTLVAILIDEFRERGRKRKIAVIGSRDVELTGREWEVLQLMREDLRTEEIATRLFVSPVTVRTHVSSILKKLRVRDRDSAVRLFEQSG